MKISKLTALAVLTFLAICLAQGPIFAGGFARQVIIEQPDDSDEVFEQTSTATLFGLLGMSELCGFATDGLTKSGLGKSLLAGAAATLGCILVAHGYDKLPNFYKQKVKDATVKVGRLVLSPKVFATGLAIAAGSYGLVIGDLKTSMGILGVGSFSYWMRNF